MHHEVSVAALHAEDFPSFSEGLSLRPMSEKTLIDRIVLDFPSFSEGLSLRPGSWRVQIRVMHFPSFSEGLSLRPQWRKDT